MESSADAAANLAHAVANYLLVIGHARTLGPAFMTVHEVGVYAMKHEPAIRAAMDEYRAACIREDLDNDPLDREERDLIDSTYEACERYHADKDDRLTEGR